MIKKKTILLFLSIMILFSLKQPTVKAVTDLDDPVDDGYITRNLGVYTRDNTSQAVQAGYLIPNIYRGYTEWNITTLPNKTVSAIFFLYRGTQHVEQVNITLLTIRPSILGPADNNTIYWRIGNETIVASELTFPIDAENQEIMLNTQAITSLQAALTAGQTWWALGYINVNETGPGDSRGAWQSQEAPAPNPPPTLRVAYTDDPTYQFSDTYFENGTRRIPAVNVTTSGPGFTDVFSTSGGNTRYYSVQPTLFQWPITDGVNTATRRIYTRSSTNENYTVTYPESTFDTYVFTVRDFTGKLAQGTGYLEAYRIINGTTTLIERQVIDVHNEVPLNLVTGATYTIIVRFSDGSTYNWGTYVPGDSTTFTIVLRGVAFSDQAYQVSNFITVEINRTGGTLFTIAYQTTQNTTIWANVTIQIRNGAIVNQVSRTNNSFIYNYAGALANTSYVVLVNGEHTLMRQWGYTKIFDATETYPNIPNIENIFHMGLLNAANLIGWALTVGTGGLTYSINMKRASLFAMCTMASFLSIFGFTDWGNDLLTLSWFFSLIVFVGSADRS